MKNTVKATISLAVCAAALFLGTPVSAQTQTPSKRVLLVSIPDRKLAVVEDGTVKKIYPVAVGKSSTPSPTGTFTIKVRVTNPTYYHQGKIVDPGPDNPVGTRWIGLNQKGYGIHGTNAPNSIGKAASHGCIRMKKLDLEELFLKVQIGDQVEIHGERDAQVAQIFEGEKPEEKNAAISEALVASVAMPQSDGNSSGQ
jgi:lipoprotein-anchoring transpeptidase ErfK/SrfK